MINSESKIEISIKNYVDLFIYISLNHMSIRSCLVSQLNNNCKQLFNTMNLSPISFGVILPPNQRGKISTNLQNNPRFSDENEKLFNATDLSPITFGVILPPNPWVKISTNSQNNPRFSDENENSKVLTIKILLDSGASVYNVRKDVLYKRLKILKNSITLGQI